MSEKEQEELLGLMEHKQAVEAQPKEFRMDLNIKRRDLCKKILDAKSAVNLYMG